jgi:hypothetical protein
MSRLATDREILRLIYETYKDRYPGKKSETGRGENDPYVPIDLVSLAHQLNCNPELLFGRLYYHLDRTHRYRQDNNALVPLFYLKLDERMHVIHFPYLSSILADLEDKHRRERWALGISIVALVVSIASVAANMMTG